MKKCPENKRIYEEEKICLDECYPFQFEYNNTCYNDCPSDKYRLFGYRNICSDSIPDNYYLDNNDNIYKECCVLHVKIVFKKEIQLFLKIIIL